MAAKSASSGKEKLLDEQEEVLQAVVLADSFNKRFRPLTTKKPRCLLPICNAPLLDWTFESLALAGVQEVFVICRCHAEQVKNAIKDSKWSKPGSGMKIVPITTAKETFSPGDAMRDIYTRGLVTSDFVLVTGDLVSNVRIDEVVRAHKERRRVSKDAIMTMVVKESGVEHRTRSRGDSALFVLDARTDECLHYESVLGYPKKKLAHIPREVLAAHKDVDIRYDLIDCGIDVCSVEVPSLFQDNFDYLDMRRDFVHGILTSDLLMKTIHVYIAKDGYAARVQDTRSYESISKDILSRWTFPLVPDDNYPGSTRYEYTRGNRYLAKDNSAILSRTCKIGSNTLIGASTHICDNVKITASVIGPNCVIGPGSVVENSYIFENTVIGADCRVTRSIVGAGATIKDGSTVERGALIGDKVVIGPGARLKPFDRLSVPWKGKKEEGEKEEDEEDEDEGEEDEEEEEEEDSDIEEVEANQSSIDKSELGPDSNAIVWLNKPPEEEEDLESPENYLNQRFMRLADDAADLQQSEGGAATDKEGEDNSDEEDEEDEDGFDSHTDAGSVSGRSDLSLSHATLGDSNLMADKEFRNEVKQSLERAFAENHSVDNAAVELKTLRMASNVPLTRVKEAVIGAIVEKIAIVEEGGAAAQRKEVQDVVVRWGELINRIGGVDPLETISLLQRHCAGSSRMGLFGQILAALYQDDIVEEDDIRAWHVLPSARGEDLKAGEERDKMGKCWIVGAQLIHQLDEQESEEESDEEEEEEEEEHPASAAASSAAETSSGSEEEEEDEQVNRSGGEEEEESD